MTALTDEQIQNWRKVLTYRFGLYALIMPVEQIQTLHDAMQYQVDEMARLEKSEPEFCQCDPQKHGYTRHMDDSVTCNKCQKPRQVTK